MFLIRWFICSGKVRNPVRCKERKRKKKDLCFLLETPELIQWKHVSALHCWNNSIIFWHESICDSDSCSMGPHKEMECPLFCHPWVHCHCSLSSRLVRYAGFLGKWDFLSVDIIYSRTTDKVHSNSHWWASKVFQNWCIPDVSLHLNLYLKVCSEVFQCFLNGFIQLRDHILCLHGCSLRWSCLYLHCELNGPVHNRSHVESILSWRGGRKGSEK